MGSFSAAVCLLVSAAHANRGSGNRAGRGGSGGGGGMGSSQGGSRDGGGSDGGGGRGGGRGGLLEAACPLAVSHQLDDGVGLCLQLPHRRLDAAGRAQAGGAWRGREVGTPLAAYS